MEEQFDTAVLLRRNGSGASASSLAEVVAGGELEHNDGFAIPAGAQDTGLRLLGSHVVLRRVSLSDDDQRNVIDVTCEYAIDARMIRRTAAALSRQLAVFEVAGAQGRCYRRGWPIAYTLVDPSRWPAHDPSTPSARSLAVRVNYPLLLPRKLPPGDYSVALSVRDHLAAPALCNASLGTVRVPPGSGDR